MDDSERALLVRLLDENFEGAAELREQVSSALVTGGDATWLDLKVDPAAPTAACGDGPIPVDAWACDPAGNPIGALLVWVDGGRLSAIEYGWVTDDEPSSLPPASSITLNVTPGR